MMTMHRPTRSQTVRTLVMTIVSLLLAMAVHTTFAWTVPIGPSVGALWSLTGVALVALGTWFGGFWPYAQRQSLGTEIAHLLLQVCGFLLLTAGLALSMERLA